MERRGFLKAIVAAAAAVATGTLITLQAAKAAVLPVLDKRSAPSEAPKVETKFRPSVDTLQTEQVQFRRGGRRRIRRTMRRQRRINRRMRRRGSM